MTGATQRPSSFLFRARIDSTYVWCSRGGALPFSSW